MDENVYVFVCLCVRIVCMSVCVSVFVCICALYMCMHVLYVAVSSVWILSIAMCVWCV